MKIDVDIKTFGSLNAVWAERNTVVITNRTVNCFKKSSWINLLYDLSMEN